MLTLIVLKCVICGEECEELSSHQIPSNGYVCEACEPPAIEADEVDMGRTWDGEELSYPFVV